MNTHAVSIHLCSSFQFRNAVLEKVKMYCWVFCLVFCFGGSCLIFALLGGLSLFVCLFV